MENNILQNVDIPQVNPLASSNPENHDPSPKKAKLNFQDPKIIALVVLGVVFAILLILAIIVTVIRKASPQPVNKPPQKNNPASTVVPTVNQSLIPTQFQEKFTKIENQLRTDEDFVPPQIDTSIGL